MRTRAPHTAGAKRTPPPATPPPATPRNHSLPRYPRLSVFMARGSRPRCPWAPAGSLPLSAVWEAHLASYVARHPRTRVLDPPAAIHATEDRGAMLAAIPPSGLRLRLPTTAAAASATPIANSSPDPAPRCEDQDRQQQQLQQQRAASSSSATAAVADGGCGQRGGAAGAAAAAVAVAGEPSARCRAVEVRAPAQAVVRSRTELRALAAGEPGCRPVGLRPPLILKTQRADAAGGGGHGLAVALSWVELEDRAQELQRAPAGAAAAATACAGAGPSIVISRGDGDRGGGVDGDGDDDGAGGHWVPLVVQQYVPHTENLYKVYVLGRHVQAERRASLTLTQLAALGGQEQAGEAAQRPPSPPNRSVAAAAVGGAAAAAAPRLTLQHLSAQPQPQPQPQPRAAGGAGTGHGAATAPAAAGESCGSSGLADGEVLAAVARELSRRMGLTMFNFDVVVPISVPDLGPEQSGRDEDAAAPPTAAGMDSKAGAAAAPWRPEPSSADSVDAGAGGEGVLLLYVVDVNYFPGYDKLSGWEVHLVDHLRAAADQAVRPREP